MSSGTTRWSSEEDLLLRGAMEGKDAETVNWKTVAESVGSRAAASCYQHWKRVRGPLISHDPFTESEMRKLAYCVRLFGDHKWSSVAKALNGRPDCQCRCQWTRVLRQKSAFHAFLVKCATSPSVEITEYLLDLPTSDTERCRKGLPDKSRGSRCFGLSQRVRSSTSGGGIALMVPQCFRSKFRVCLNPLSSSSRPSACAASSSSAPPPHSSSSSLGSEAAAGDSVDQCLSVLTADFAAEKKANDEKEKRSVVMKRISSSDGMCKTSEKDLDEWISELAPTSLREEVVALPAPHPALSVASSSSCGRQEVSSPMLSSSSSSRIFHDFEWAVLAGGLANGDPTNSSRGGERAEEVVVEKKKTKKRKKRKMGECSSKKHSEADCYAAGSS